MDTVQMQKICRLWEIVKGIEGMNGVKVTLHIKINSAKVSTRLRIVGVI